MLELKVNDLSTKAFENLQESFKTVLTAKLMNKMRTTAIVTVNIHLLCKLPVLPLPGLEIVTSEVQWT